MALAERFFKTFLSPYLLLNWPVVGNNGGFFFRLFPGLIPVDTGCYLIAKSGFVRVSHNSNITQYQPVIVTISQRVDSLLNQLRHLRLFYPPGRIELFHLSDRLRLMLGLRVRVTQDHLNLAVAEQRRQRHEIHACLDGPGRECVAQVV